VENARRRPRQTGDAHNVGRPARTIAWRRWDDTNAMGKRVPASRSCPVRGLVRESGCGAGRSVLMPCSFIGPRNEPGRTDQRLGVERRRSGAKNSSTHCGRRNSYRVCPARRSCQNPARSHHRGDMRTVVPHIGSGLCARRRSGRDRRRSHGGRNYETAPIRTVCQAVHRLAVNLGAVASR